MTLLISILILFLVIFAAVYLIDMIGLPSPINMVVKAIVVLLGVLYLLQKVGISF